MAKTGDDYQGNDPRYPSQQQDRFIVRLPDGMRDRIKEAAEKNNRSMNAEIVAALEEKYPAPEPFSFDLLNEKYIAPILLAIDNPVERDRMIKEADSFLKRSHPDMGVWYSDENGRQGIAFGHTRSLERRRNRP
ncbi:MAG: Arc family DNA-binding protein [Xanthobacteraceae bacterium]